MRRFCRSLLLLLLIAQGCSHLSARRTQTGPTVDGDEVVFRFYAPAAMRVQVAGDWPENNWARGDGSVGEINVGLMEDEDGDGVWELRVKLPPGRYRYLFLVDENSWSLDPGNTEEVEGGPEGRCCQIVLFDVGGKLKLR